MEGRISKLPLDKESKFKEGLGGVPRREGSILCFRICVKLKTVLV